MLVCDFVKKLIPYYKEAFRQTLMNRHNFLAGFTRPEVEVNNRHCIESYYFLLDY